MPHPVGMKLLALLPLALVGASCGLPEYGPQALWGAEWKLNQGGTGSRTVSGSLAADAFGGLASAAVFHQPDRSEAVVIRSHPSGEHRMGFLSEFACVEEPCGPRVRMRHAVFQDTVYLTGWFGGGQQFYSTDAQGPVVSKQGVITGFIAKITGDDHYEWQFPLGGAQGELQPADIATLSDGTFAIVGRYLSPQSLQPTSFGDHLQSTGPSGFYARFHSDGRVMVAVDLPFLPLALAVDGEDRVGILSADRTLVYSERGALLAQGSLTPQGQFADLAGDPWGGWWVLSTERQPDCGEDPSLNPAQGWDGTGASRLDFLDPTGAGRAGIHFQGNATAVAVGADSLLVAGTTDQEPGSGPSSPATGTARAVVQVFDRELRAGPRYLGTPFEGMGACRATGVVGLGADRAALAAILDQERPPGPGTAGLALLGPDTGGSSEPTWGAGPVRRPGE